jgi:hypothetical protein
MLEGLKFYGCTIDKTTDTEIYISIPKHPISENNISPEQIAKKTQEVIDGLTNDKRVLTLKYRIVDREDVIIWHE